MDKDLNYVEENEDDFKIILGVGVEEYEYGLY